MKKISLLFIFTFIIFFVSLASANAAAIYDHEVTFNMNGGNYVHQDVAALGDKINAAVKPINILALGDSTSNGLTGWYYTFGGLLASEVDQYTINYRLWNTTSNSYGDKVSLQYGSNGDAYAHFDGTSGKYISAMNSDDLSIVGDIDLRAKIKADEAEAGAVVGKWNSDQLSYFLYYSLDNTGTSAKISLFWTEDGSTTISEDSDFFTVPVNTEISIRATLDVDNGAGGYTVEFFYSINGSSYTLIQSDVTTAGITSIYDSSAQTEIGSVNAGASNQFNGEIYEVEIRDGINGRIVASPDFDMAFPSTITSFKDLENNTWVINGGLSVGNGSPGLMLLNGSIAGATTATFTANVLEGMTHADIDFVLISLGHNNGVVDDYLPIIKSFVSNVELYTGDANIGLVTQNAHYSPRTEEQILAQANRMDQVILYAAEENLALFDARTALDSDPVTYISADGLHPTDDGYVIWADQIFKTINYGLSDKGVSSIKLLVEDGELVTQIDDPTKTDATFLGWYTNESLTNEWDFENDLVEDDMVLYAKWSDSVSPITGGIISSPDGTTLAIFGIAWYWWVLGGAIVYLSTSKKARKALGFKK